jgi:hypothetical protein
MSSGSIPPRVFMKEEDMARKYMRLSIVLSVPEDKIPEGTLEAHHRLQFRMNDYEDGRFPMATEQLRNAVLLGLKSAGIHLGYYEAFSYQETAEEAVRGLTDIMVRVEPCDDPVSHYWKKTERCHGDGCMMVTSREGAHYCRICGH